MSYISMLPERCLCSPAENDALEDEQAEMPEVKKELSSEIARLQDQAEELKS
jgi:hypothetical protein